MKPVKIILTALFLIVSGQLFAQESRETRYTRALEDTLVRYERLKPAYRQLQTNFTDVQVQNVSLFGDLQEEKLQHKVTGARLQQAVSQQREKWWKGFYWGWAAGAVTTAIIVLK